MGARSVAIPAQWPCHEEEQTSNPKPVSAVLCHVATGVFEGLGRGVIRSIEVLVLVTLGCPRIVPTLERLPLRVVFPDGMSPPHEVF